MDAHLAEHFQSLRVVTNSIDRDRKGTSSVTASCPETPVSIRSVDASEFGPSTTATSIAGDDDRSRASSVYSEDTHSRRRRDRALEEEVKDEESEVVVKTETITDNPYKFWECGFGYQGELDPPATIPDTKKEFLAAVKNEVQTAGFIKQGLISYLKAISSGEHHAFSEDFLKNQNHSTNIALGQLFQIVTNLEKVITEIEAIGDDTSKVNTELKEAFAHAQPWVQRTQKILVSSHVFYKINYVLASDKNKDKTKTST